MPKRSSSDLTSMPQAVVEKIYAERRKIEREKGYPICGELVAGGGICSLSKFHSGRCSGGSRA